jgi:hypothetical protein
MEVYRKHENNFGKKEGGVLGQELMKKWGMVERSPLQGSRPILLPSKEG